MEGEKVMQVSGLGKVNVPTAGTPVPFSATSLKGAKVIISFDPSDTTASVHVKDSAGNKIATLTIDSNGPLQLGNGEGNLLDLSTLWADASGNSKGPIVGFEIV
jgi:hypothetical protein